MQPIRSDPLYDPSLSAPFTAINTTSDAFAFALLVREQSMKVLGQLPFEVQNRQALETVMRARRQVWQNMSVNTIHSYNRAAGSPRRAVQLSEDRRFWLAPHNDPVFAELKKRQHVHEMPRSTPQALRQVARDLVRRKAAVAEPRRSIRRAVRSSSTNISA